MENAQSVLGLVEGRNNMMDVIKRFLLGWLAAAVFLVGYSCVKYRAFIAAAFADHMWALFNAVMPLVLIIFVLFYLIRSVFR